MSIGIIASVRTLIQPPTGVTATALTSNEVTVNWNASTGALSYKVYKDSVYYTSTTSLNINDTNVVSGRTYCYYVTAISKYSESSPSNTSCATTP